MPPAMVSSWRRAIELYSPTIEHRPQTIDYLGKTSIVRVSFTKSAQTPSYRVPFTM
jgi:hypothetical protein